VKKKTNFKLAKNKPSSGRNLTNFLLGNVPIGDVFFWHFCQESMPDQESTAEMLRGIPKG